MVYNCLGTNATIEMLSAVLTFTLTCHKHVCLSTYVLVLLKNSIKLRAKLLESGECRLSQCMQREGRGLVKITSRELLAMAVPGCHQPPTSKKSFCQQLGSSRNFNLASYQGSQVTLQVLQVHVPRQGYHTTPLATLYCAVHLSLHSPI